MAIITLELTPDSVVLEGVEVAGAAPSFVLTTVETVVEAGCEAVEVVVSALWVVYL